MTTFKSFIKARHSIPMSLTLMLVGVICISLTRGIIFGALQYWGINQSIEDKEILAEQLTEQGRRRDDVDAAIKQLETEREELARQNEVVEWCLEARGNSFAKSARDYILVGIFFISLMGACIACYGAWSFGREAKHLLKTDMACKSQNVRPRAVVKEARQFDGAEFIQDLEKIQKDFYRRNRTAEEAFAEIAEINRQFERELML